MKALLADSSFTLLTDCLITMLLIVAGAFILFFLFSVFLMIPRLFLSRKLDKHKIKSADFKLKLASAGKESEISNPYEAMIARTESSIKILEKTKDRVRGGITIIMIALCFLNFLNFAVRRISQTVNRISQSSFENNAAPTSSARE